MYTVNKDVGWNSLSPQGCSEKETSRNWTWNSHFEAAFIAFLFEMKASPAINYLALWLITRSHRPHLFPDLLLSCGVLMKFVQQLLPHNLYFHYNIGDYYRFMKSFHYIWCAFLMWHCFHYRPYSASQNLFKTTVTTAVLSGGRTNTFPLPTLGNKLYCL
jgi:hypothetical protein